MTDLRARIQHRLDTQTKPLGALGKLETLGLKAGLWLGSERPEITVPSMVVFAADHGIVDAGVSAYPKEVTWQMVMNFVAGGAAINVLCRQHGIDLRVVNAGVDYVFPEGVEVVDACVARGSANILDAPAMTDAQLQQALERGAAVVAERAAAGCNLISFGEMGIGNTSIASLLMHRYLDLPLSECVGAGTGVRGEALARKLAILERAAARHSPRTPHEILQTFGGFEVAMMTGAYLEAWRRKMLIVVDGFIATSALLAAWRMEPSVLEACVFSHCSDEAGHATMLRAMGADPILALDMRLGEGSGAAVAFPIVQSAVSLLREMATFEDAGVSRNDEQS